MGWGDLGAIAEPLALEYLAAALGEDGHVCRILDLRLHPDALEATLETFRPDLVGITAFSMHVRRAKAIASVAKSCLPHIRTIVGGHHATFLPDDFFEPAIDYVVSGDGIGLIRSVAHALDSGTELQLEPGLYVRDGQTGSFAGAGRSVPGVAEFRDAPLPDRRLTAADRSRYFIDNMKPVALMRTTAGCPYRCTFCSIWHTLDGQYYIRDIGRVVDEIAAIEEENIFLVDDEAFINQRRMIALASAIRERGLRKKYFTYCRIDTLLRNQEAIKAWRDIGLTRLFIGIDAISELDLVSYRKKCSVTQIEQGLELARKLGIDIFAQFVVAPTASARTFKNLVRFIEHQGVDYPSFTVLTPLPGTELLENFDSVTERQPDGRPDWDLFDCQNAVTQTALPPDVFRKEYRNLYKVFKGAYTRYREHNSIIHELDARDALASGHPTSAVHLVAKHQTRRSVI
ncbi:radical SAM protein [Rhizobium sp. FY34]|uniref:B12-binding domain-containing radical SAM protein n=1 Tax=Rhizobium sp. FY34 TaxID=2562309 RepID=UPI002484780A|nr:radical SAM protein [Rhizobium sp. FY34]